jgi:hypothetical protein
MNEQTLSAGRHRNPYTDYFFIYSRKVGNKRWERHIPGCRTRELAERAAAEWRHRIARSEHPTREYVVVDEFESDLATVLSSDGSVK